MRKMIYGGLFLSLMGIVVGCKKDEVANQQKENIISNQSSKTTQLLSEVEFDGELIHFEYYYNNDLQDDPDYQLDSLLNLIEGLEYEEEYIIRIHSFSDYNAYNEFLTDYPDLQENLALDNVFINRIHEYIDNNPDIISECEDNNNCGDYLAFQDSLSDKIYGAIFSSKSPTTIKSGFCSGSTWVMTMPIVPFMAPGWNNQTSAFFNLNIVSRVNLYGSRFFRHRMATFFGFHGWQFIPFTGGLSFLNNKTSSCIH